MKGGAAFRASRFDLASEVVAAKGAKTHFDELPAKERT